MSTKFTKDHSIAIVALIGAIMGFVGSIGQVYFDYQKNQNALTYEQQIESLNDVVKSIDTLKEFVVEQKENLKESQKSLSELQAKQDQLKPVIEADQKAIDAIFALQAEQNKKNIWWERAIGFFLGVAGSLVASLIWSYMRRNA
jgi:chromosome segregation ATPase